MKIELCENDAILNNGAPTLVVLVVTNDHGKQFRLPYQADKTIQMLYVEVEKIMLKENFGIQEKPESSVINASTFRGPSEHIIKPLDPTIFSQKNVVLKNESSLLNNQIEREDIVKCVKIYPRDPGADCDLVLGNEYRVINIIKVNKQVSSYEVLDDKSGNKTRIPTLPDEVELFNKRKLKPLNKGKKIFEIIAKCDECHEDNVLELNGECYMGICEKCGKDIKKSRNQPV